MALQVIRCSGQRKEKDQRKERKEKKELKLETRYLALLGEIVDPYIT